VLHAFTDPPLSPAVAVYFQRSIVLHYFHHAFPAPSFLSSCSLIFPASLFHVIFIRPLQPVTSHALLYRLSPVLTPHPYSIPFLSAVHSPTHPLLLLSFLPAFLLLSGDIELNPGPVSFTLGTLNIRSFLHPLHSGALSDLINAHHPDLFCLTETRIKPTTTFTELLSCTPPNYSLV